MAAAVAFALALAAAFGGAAEAEPSPGPPSPGASAPAGEARPTDAEGWLHRLEGLARGRRGLDARLRYTTVQGLLDDEQVRYGRLRVLHADPAAAEGGGPEAADRFRIDLDGEAVDDTLRKLQRRLVWDGERLLDVDALRREASVRRVQDEDELSETLPIPMRIDAADLLQRYEVRWIPAEDPSEPIAGSPGASAVHLRLVSREDPEADPLDVWFDAGSGLPLRGRSGRVGGDTRSVELVNPEAVDGFEPDLFRTEPPRGEGWRVQESGGDDSGGPVAD